MRADRKREPGFYWVRFGADIIIAEYSVMCVGCAAKRHWHVSGVNACFRDIAINELLSARLSPPLELTPKKRRKKKP